jgi:hypothetical protein
VAQTPRSGVLAHRSPEPLGRSLLIRSPPPSVDTPRA